MLTKKDYCDCETCVALKELGYIGTSQYFYTTKDSPLRMCQRNQTLTIRTASAIGHTLAVHLYEAQKFLREEKGVDTIVHLLRFNDGKRYCASISIQGHRITVLEEGTNCMIEPLLFECYEDALADGISRAVDILSGIHYKQSHSSRYVYIRE